MFTYCTSDEFEIYRGMDKWYYVREGESIRKFMLIHELEYYLLSIKHTVPPFVFDMITKEKTAVFIVDAHDGFSVRTVDFYMYGLTLVEARAIIKILLSNAYGIPIFELDKVKLNDD